MQEMMDELSDCGAERVSLEVRAHNIAAVKLYKRFGFVDIFVRKNYYHDPEDDALIFQLIKCFQNRYVRKEWIKA